MSNLLVCPAADRMQHCREMLRSDGSRLSAHTPVRGSLSLQAIYRMNRQMASRLSHEHMLPCCVDIDAGDSVHIGSRGAGSCCIMPQQQATLSLQAEGGCRYVLLPRFIHSHEVLCRMQ